MPLTTFASPEQLAYIAGLFDGEGSISLVRSFAKRTRGRYVYPLVRIANTDKPTLLWVQSVIGGGAWTRSIPSENRHLRRSVWHLAWAATEAIRVLEALLEYLQIKRPQAELVLELERKTTLMRQELGYFGNGHPLPEALVRAREFAFYGVRALNQGMIGASPLTKKGREIKRAMQKTYGKKRGTSVFYASANKGTIKGVHGKRRRKR